MTRKDYKLIAERINAHVNSWRETEANDPRTSGGALMALRQVVYSLNVVFSEQHKGEGSYAYKPEVFTKACGF